MEYTEAMMQNQYDAQNQLIMELDQVRAERDALLAQVADAFGDGYYDGFLDGAKHHEQTDCNTDPQYLGDDAMRCSEIAESEKAARLGMPAKQQCLAEIRAEAARAGYLQGVLDEIGDPEYAELRAKQFAAKVRQGGE